MASLDDQVAGLYQIPLAEFTAARDALAKTAGASGPAIKKLVKPQAAAWAVNQVYWRRRPIFDKLVTAGERLRAAHAKRLTGKSTDVDMADAAHRAALTTAVNAARDLLAGSGDAATDTTMTAVRETFETWPWPEPIGRLTKPVRPSGGFGALAGLLQGAAVKSGRKADVLPMAPPAPRASELPSPAQKEKADEAERRKALAVVTKQLRAAEDEHREAMSALTQARKAFDRSERDLERVQRELQEAERAVEQVRSELQAQRVAVNDATTRSRLTTDERDRLARRVSELESD